MRQISSLGHSTALAWFHRHDQGLLTLTTGALLLFGYHWALYRSGPLAAAALVAVCCVFIATLIALEVGIAVIILSMLLSPEIPIAVLPGRVFTLRFEDLMIPFVAFAWLARKALGVERRELRHDPVLYAMTAFVGIQLLSTTLGSEFSGVDFRTGMLYIIKQLEYFAIFYFAFQYVDTEKRLRMLLSFAFFTAATIAVYNLFKIPGNAVWTRHRISAPFEGGSPEPSSIGGYFVLILALLLAFALTAPNRKLRWLFSVLFAVVFIPFLYTLSRTSYVAFLAMALLLAVLTRSRKLTAMLTIGLALSPILMPQSVIDRVLFTFNDHIRVLGVDRSFGERLFIWYKVWWNMRDDPWLGKGVTFHGVIDSYYARVLIETGVLGLIAFGFIIYRLFQIARRVRVGHPAWWARGFALGYTAALVGLLVHSFSAITFVIVRIMEPFWLVTGILAALASQVGSLPAPQRVGGEPGHEDPTEAQEEAPAVNPPRRLGRLPIHE